MAKVVLKVNASVYRPPTSAIVSRQRHQNALSVKDWEAGKMAPEQEAKLVEDMIHEHDSYCMDEIGGLRNPDLRKHRMQAALAVAEQAIRDDYERMVYEEYGDNVGDMISAMKGKTP